MSNASVRRIVAASIVLTLLLSVNTVLEAARIVKFRNFSRNSEHRVTASPLLSPQEAEAQLQTLAAAIKTNYRKIADSDLQRAKKLLVAANDSLLLSLAKEDAKTAENWTKTLKLEELKAALQADVPNSSVLEEVQNVLYSDEEGVRWTLFDGLRSALRRYQNIEKLLENNSYDKQLVNVLDNLSKYIDKYKENYDPQYASALTDVTGWLDDVSLIEPRTAKLAALTLAAVSGENLHLQVAEDFIKVAFERKLSETLEINENILGTKVVGEGKIEGFSTAALSPSKNAATIKVLVDAALETHTDGVHPPVTLKNHTTGTLNGEKTVQITSQAVTAKPARTQANLNSEVSNVRINAGHLVKLLARTQIESKKEESEAEAERRAARRMNRRIDEQVDPRIEDLDKQYQNIREPLVKAGLFPKVFNLSSTGDKIDWSIIAATLNQPSAPVPAPELKSDYGLALRLHQSSINNIASAFLAGRFIDEEKSSQRLAKYFKNPPKFLERNSDVSPAKVSFAQKVPVDVSFDGNKIKVVVRLEDIQVLNSSDKSYVITVEYNISTEKKDGKDVVILEQTVADAFPSSYKKGSDARLSAVQTIIRSYLLRRLEVLPKRIEGEPLAIEGEWKGKGSLVPAFASAENGWLTFAWNWILSN